MKPARPGNPGNETLTSPPYAHHPTERQIQHQTKNTSVDSRVIVFIPEVRHGIGNSWATERLTPGLRSAKDALELPVLKKEYSLIRAFLA
ncbi:hypothetical protein BH10CYA1_BH10CYA1_03670 [soil metagenome]